MDPVDGLNPLLESLRRQLAENVERLRKSGKLGSAQAARPPQGVPSTLEATLRRKIKTIDRTTTGGRTQAARAFVQAVLAAEFGEGVASDQAFGSLLGELSSSLMADGDMQQRMEQMFDAL
jgi:hypothetical protein